MEKQIIEVKLETDVLHTPPPLTVLLVGLSGVTADIWLMLRLMLHLHCSKHSACQWQHTAAADFEEQVISRKRKSQFYLSETNILWRRGTPIRMFAYLLSPDPAFSVVHYLASVDLFIWWGGNDHVWWHGLSVACCREGVHFISENILFISFTHNYHM